MWRAAGWGELLSYDLFAQGGGEGLSASVSTDSHPYELYLQLNEIQHKRTRVVPPQTNGFVERFHRTVLEEFFRPVFHTGFYERVAALQSDLDAWLVECNTQRPHQGYRNRGRRPWEVIQEYLKPPQSVSSPAAASERLGAQRPLTAASTGLYAPKRLGKTLFSMILWMIQVNGKIVRNTS